MNRAFAAVLSLAGLFLAGCANPAVSIHPLYSASDKHATDPQVLGEWLSHTLVTADTPDESSEHWILTPQEDGCYQAELQKRNSDGQLERTSYRTCLVTLENKLFFDSEFSEKQNGTQIIRAKEMEPGMAPAHIVGRIWVARDLLRIVQLDSAWVKSNVPEEKRAISGGAVVFTGSTHELQSVLLQHADDRAALTQTWYLCRPGSDCGPRLAEDELSRAPDDPDILGQATQFFIRRGDYAKALQLARHRVTLQPHEAEAHLQLADALAFNRDFVSTRAELAETMKLDPSDDHSGEALIGLTYFFESNYAAAEKSLAQMPRLEMNASLVLVRYACLSRMGKQKQAEKFLAQQMADFVGPQDEQLLLLRAGGRVKDYSPSFTDDQIEGGEALFYAIARAAKGDSPSARSVLEATLRRIRKDNPALIGAQIELQRLDKGGAK